jgi:hypothetical protein
MYIAPTFTVSEARETIRHYFSQVPVATDMDMAAECLTDAERERGIEGDIARGEYLIGLFDNPTGEISIDLRAAIGVLETASAQ